MLIKCENCSKMYNVPDEKWLNFKPHFFKCSVCGTVFKSPLQSEIIAHENTSKVTPLAEIFTEHPEEKQTVSNIKTQIFEPVKVKKTLPWSKIILGSCACITTAICLLFMISVIRLYLHHPEEKLIQNKDFTFTNTHFVVSPKNNLFISGKLVNLTNRDKTMPFILVSLKNNKNKELQRQYKKLKKGKLESNETIDFNIGIENIHPDSFKIEIAAEEHK